MAIVLIVPSTPNADSPTKRDLIEQAYEQAGSSGYEFDHSPEEIASGLRALNSFMYQWPWKGLGYNYPTSGNGLPDDLSGISREFQDAVSSHLALRIVPGMGASLSGEATAALVRSAALVQANMVSIPNVLLAPNTVSGAGNRFFSPFINENQSSTELDQGDVELDENGGVELRE